MELSTIIITKLKELFGIILSEQRISLFIVIQRGDANMWDIVIGGDCLRTKKNIDSILKIINRIFKKNEIILFSRLILLNLDNSFLNSINQTFSAEGGSIKIENTRINKILIKNAYLFYSKSKKEKENFNFKEVSSNLTASKNINLNDKY